MAPAGSGRTPGAPGDFERDNRDGVSGTGRPRGHLRCRTRCRLRPPRGGTRRISHGRPADLTAPAWSPRAARVTASRRCHPLEGAAGRPQNAPQPWVDVRPGRGLRRQRPRRAPQGPPRDTADAAAAAQGREPRPRVRAPALRWRRAAPPAEARPARPELTWQRLHPAPAARARLTPAAAAAPGPASRQRPSRPRPGPIGVARPAHRPIPALPRRARPALSAPAANGAPPDRKSVV